MPPPIAAGWEKAFTAGVEGWKRGLAIWRLYMRAPSDNPRAPVPRKGPERGSGPALHRPAVRQYAYKGVSYVISSRLNPSSVNVADRLGFVLRNKMDIRMFLPDPALARDVPRRISGKGCMLLSWTDIICLGSVRLRTGPKASLGR